MGTSGSLVVFRRQPRSFQNASELFFSGDFSACLDSVIDSSTFFDTTLRIRCLVRSGKFAEALALTDSYLRNVEPGSNAERGELLMHRANVLSRMPSLGQPSDSECFAEARAYVFSAGCSGLEAELIHCEGFGLMMLGDMNGAAKAAGDVLALDRYAGEVDHFIPLEHTKARAYDLLAFLFARQEDYKKQQSLALSALCECDSVATKDYFLEAHLMWNYAIFVREFGDDGTFRARFNKMPVLGPLARQRYEILRALAWSNAFRGDYLGTFRDLRDAGDVAPNFPQKIQATLDRCYFSRELNQILSAQEELDFADRLASRVDWNMAATEDGALQTLVHLSEALATLSPVRARRLFERYKSLKAKLPSNHLASSDRRAWAEELVADATISNAEGNQNRARSLYLDAFNIWDSLGYGVRAALVARELAALGAGERFAEYAAKEAALRPRSWLATSLANRPAVSV